MQSIQPHALIRLCRLIALIFSATVLAACVAKDNTSSSAATVSSAKPESSSSAVSSLAQSSSLAAESSSVAVSSSSESSSSESSEIVASSSSESISSEIASSLESSSSESSIEASSSSASGDFVTLRIQAQDYDRSNFIENTPSAREATASGVCAEGGLELIDLEDVTDENGVCAISYTEPGEYVQYNINLPTGNYDFTLRSASDTGSAATQNLAVDGSSIGSVKASALGWNTYGSGTLYDVNVAGGPIVLSVTFENAASNLNYIEISKSNGVPPASSSEASSSSSSGSNGLGTIIDDASYNPSKSKGVMRYGSPEFYLGGFEAGNYACFDNVDLTGVKSLNLRYGRLHDSIGRVAVYLGSAAITEDPAVTNPEQGSNIGEFETLSTGGYENFDNVTFGLNAPIDGEQTLCFRAVLGGGVLNLDNFTLSDADVGQNLTPTNYTWQKPTAPTQLPAISVADGKVKFGGEARSIAGVSLFWSNFGWGGSGFYTKEAVKSLKENWNVKLIRVAFGTDDFGSYFDDFWSHRIKLFEVVNAAIENDMYVIIDWHAHTIKRDTSKNPALSPEAFFKEMATKYGEFPNVIYEVFNEPLGENWSSSIKPYAEGVISEIRAIDPDNLIIVGTPNWSQDVDEAAKDPINATNIAYTLHFYADSHRADLRQKAINALANPNKPALFVTEWGTVAAAGTGSPNYAETILWMNFLRENNISHANWALVDNKTADRLDPSSATHGSSILNFGSDFNGNWSTGDLTPSGKFVMDILDNWDNWENWNKSPYQ